MEWLILGVLFGVAAWGLASLAHANNISIRWYAWLLVVLAALLAALTAMDYAILTTEQEPGAASVILWLFGGPALVLALLAVACVWWQNRGVLRAPKKS